MFRQRPDADLIVQGWVVGVMVEIAGERLPVRHYFAVGKPDRAQAEWAAVDLAMQTGPVASSPSAGREPVEALREVVAFKMRELGLKPGEARALGDKFCRELTPWLSFELRGRRYDLPPRMYRPSKHSWDPRIGLSRHHAGCIVPPMTYDAGSSEPLPPTLNPPPPAADPGRGRAPGPDRRAGLRRARRRKGPTRCRLTPQVTQGPYWFDPKLNRADVTEGKPGVPVRVAVTVVDGGCRPIPGARVDLWHCDAAGIYSGYEGQGDDHGTGAKGADLPARGPGHRRRGPGDFASIWPGWYEGRTPHMHLKVFLDARTVLTSQLFVPDALSEWLYDNVPAYRRPRKRDTFNRQDGIALQGGEAMVAAVKELKDGYEWP
jgi:protocatechuate 3,4-dioxygenase beta subunit